MSIWTSSVLCEEEIDELKKSTTFTIIEIEALYERFKYLDKSNSGFLTFVEFQLIPEFYSNPFCSLILNYFEKLHSCEKITFGIYMEFLNIFNFKTPKSTRIAFLFSFFDLDNSGHITRNNLIEINKVMMSTSDTKLEELDYSNFEKNADDVLKHYDRGNKGYLNKKDFERFYNSDPSLEENMIVDIKRFTGELDDNDDFFDIIWSYI